MSSDNPNRKPQSNEEIVEELTKELKDYSLTEDIHVPSSKPPKTEERPNSPTTKHNVEVDAEHNSEYEEEKPKETNDLNDYIDEDELKLLDSTLTDEQKLQRLNNALELKAQGNSVHKCDKFLEAVQHYTEALRLCPIDNQKVRSVLYCNRAASKIHLKYKKSAIDDCSKAIELNSSYVRAYLRRAKLYEETDKLDESLEDYKKILEFDPGNPDALKASVRLPPLINERNEKLKTEMMGKLKDVGNMILKPFGLSTNNFNLQQDPNTGGYTINFQQ